MLVYWIIVMLLFFFFRFYGIEDTPGIELSQPLYYMITENFVFVGMGAVAATIYAILQLLDHRPFFQRRPLGFLLFIKALLTFFLLCGISLIILNLTPYHSASNSPKNPLLFRPFWTFLLYFFIAASVASFIRTIIEKFSPRQFFKLISGRYRFPVQEERVFLFIDLKSSVTYAERLGHQRYSELLQECFYDLDESVIRYDGEIYQYVGDEVVVTWPLDKGIDQGKCVKCFLDFDRRIQHRKEFYLEHFDALPEFKAGVHGGLLTAVEIGSQKKEIAYHGDVINAASRIQGACNKLKQRFLISADLAARLQTIGLIDVGELSLRGRQTKMKLLAVPVSQ